MIYIECTCISKINDPSEEYMLATLNQGVGVDNDHIPLHVFVPIEPLYFRQI